MFRKFLSFAAIAAMTGFALTAQAADVKYDYAELRFVDTEIGSVDGDGFKIGGSFRLTEEWFLLGSYSNLDFDFGIDGSLLEFGGGYIYPNSDNVDLVAIAKIIRADIDAGSGVDADETGFGLAGGIRTMFTPQIEGRAFANYVDVDDSDTFLELAGDYHFNEQLSAGISLEVLGDADTLTFGVRWYFDR